MIPQLAAIASGVSVLARFPSVLYRITAIFGGWFSLSRLTAWVMTFISFGLFTVGIPLAIEWGLFNVMSVFSDTITGNFSLSPTVITLSGCAAWLADCFQLPLVLSIQLGFALQTLMLRMVSGRKIVRF